MERMGEDGEDKLIAMARHIARTLGRTDTMADDILQIFSNFDGRFSREKLSDEHPALSSLERRLRAYVSSDRPIWSDSGAASEFLSALDDLIAAGGLHPRADDLLQQCMLRLEEEFRMLIEQPAGTIDSGDEEDDSDGEDSIPVAYPVADYDIIIDAIPPGTVADLHSIATRMVAAGFAKECAHIYALSRRDFLDESVSRLGIRARTSEELQATPWGELEDEIARWVRAMSVAVRILFPSERRLCDKVFAGLSQAADLAFAEACRGTAIQLLGFADAVAVVSRAPERLFKVLDMYEAVRDLIPEIESLFSDQYSSFLRSEAFAIWKGLGAAIRGIFMELENLIRRDPAKASVPGGGLHPITRYVMNYLRAACASRRTLEQVMDDDGGSGLATTDLDRPSSSLAVQIAWIMEVLQSNLEAKSKVYKDPSLSLVFLMNNGRYISQKARDGELGALLGEEWARREAARLRRWMTEYQRMAWGKVVAVLKTDGPGGGGSGKAMRERLRLFNGYFEDVWREQRGWVVPDERLREELREAAVGMVVPAYEGFLGRLRVVEGGRGVEKQLLMFSVGDVETRIGDLFQGSSSVRRP
ncbi:Exocyst complex component Exo70 protein [Dioscorea alata]|uniref:Exocyst complex component Exo70 protein n=1 Tax=Dioscorea alata TaxID=55571 RepID=A0ACB7U8Q9_DIOAL|nr:Exocyst complex component Exo70 protein [Dioscorea alata]